MKIGYVMQAGVPEVRFPPYSGPAVHVLRVVEGLKSIGHQVRLIVLLDNRIWRSDDLEHFVPVTVPWLERGPFRWLEKLIRRLQFELRLPYAAFFESLRFSEACKKELKGFDIIYERMGWVGYGGSLSARRLNIPLVLEVNGDHLDELEMKGVSPRGAQRWLSIRLMQQAVRQASHIVAAGEGWKKKFIQRWGNDQNWISVVENGSEYVALLKRENLRAFALNDQPACPVVVLYIGAFEPWHGLDVLVQAFAKSLSSGIQLQLVLVGSGSQQLEIEQWVQKLNLQSSVTLTGHLPPELLAEQLAHADIGVSPYCGRAEYSGLKLLDYKAAGLAVIASGKDGQPAVVEHGINGYIVPPCDIDALSMAINKIAQDADFRRRIGREARFEAEKQHSWHATVKNLEEIFQSLQTNG